MIKYSDYITVCNTHDIDEFTPWYIANDLIGYMHYTLVKKMLEMGYPFDTQHQNVLCLSESLSTLQERSRAITDAFSILGQSNENLILRNELFDVKSPVTGEIVLQLDRAILDHLGIISQGVHLNGLAGHSTGLKMWVAQRSDTTSYPGQLDNIAAGGLPSGLSLKENIMKEAWEEATIPSSISSNARYKGFVSYIMQENTLLKRHILYIYDLILPDDIIPTPNDGSVASFNLYTLEQVDRIIKSSENNFKFNCNLVLIDFFIRYGLINTTHPHSSTIASNLRPLNAIKVE